MANPNFGSILDKPTTEIERPKPLPVGTYTCVVKGLPRFDKSAKKGTEFVEFTLQPLQASEDVDADALESMGGFANKTIRATFYLTEDSVWRLKKFLVDDLEIDEDDTLRPMIDQAPGKQVNATLRHTASQDGQSVYAELASTAPVE